MKSPLKPATTGKSLLSGLLDLLMTIGMMVGLYYALGRPVFLNQGPYATALVERADFVRATGLLEEKQTEEFTYFVFEDKEGEPYAYQRYVDLVWHYLTDVVVKQSRYSTQVTFKGSNGETIPSYGSEASALTKEYGAYVYRYYFGYVEGGENLLFVPSIEGDFTSKPVAAVEEASNAEALKNAMLSPSGKSGHYLDAVAHIAAQPNLKAYADAVSRYSYLSTLPGYLFSPFLFFFLLPMALPGSKTLGKLIMGLKVVDVRGFAANKGQIVLRQGFVTLLFFILALPFGSYALMAAVVLLGVDLMSRAASAKGLALHDRLSSTMVVDQSLALPYTSKADYEQHAEAEKGINGSNPQ